MYDAEDIRPVIENLCSSSLIISPWLAYVGGKVRFDSYIFDLFYWGARDFASAHWRREYATSAFGNLPVPSRLPRTAIYETAASTAVYLAYEQTGQPNPTDRHVKDALHLTEDFALKFGFDYFLSAYAMLTMYENYTALHYYGSMKEADFLSGRLHRPWIDYELDDELIVSCELGTTEIFVQDSERYVRLTDYGQQRFQISWTLLKDTGYLKKRNQSLRISHFSELEDYESIIAQIAPHLAQLRYDHLKFSRIQPGMRVLEIGCGSGAFTFDSGLADLVGSSGEIIATDPAHKMIERAIAKRNTLKSPKPWVEFVQTKAETLPFADNSFDAVIGMICLHLTDIPRAVKEIARVLKPGGIFASFHPLSFPMSNPIVEAWFAPVANLLARPAQENMLPEIDTVPAALEPFFTEIEHREITSPNVYNDPDIVARFYVESLGLFDDEITGIPWPERTRLINEIRCNGKHICETHTKEELTVEYPGQLVRAVLPE